MILTSIFCSCTKEDKEATSDIVGKWKLETVSYRDKELLQLDYSQNNIIYDFKENNVLIVSGDMDSIDDYRGHRKGKHSFKILPTPPSGPAGPCSSSQIKIGAKTHRISSGWVFFDFYEGVARHIDTNNETLILVRVEE